MPSGGTETYTRAAAMAPTANGRPADVRVLALATYPLGSVPAQRFRFEQYLEPLAQEGIAVDVSCLMDRSTAGILHRRGHVRAKVAYLGRGLARRLRDLHRARRYDVVFVSRETYPLGPAVLERVLGMLEVPYVFDFDDAIYLPNASNANRFIAPLKFPGRVRSVVENAALVIAGNDHLAAFAHGHNARVRVIPTTIDTERYRRLDGRRNREKVCIGWSGSLTTIQHLEGISPVLGAIQRDEGIRLLVIGDEGFRIPGAAVEARPWRGSSELEDLSELDVGVMPLPDDEWARGKCGLKALQYMALGIPTVMSPVGVNTHIARGGAAQLARTPAEWDLALRRLIREPARRERLGGEGRRRVEEEYSVKANLPKYVAAFRDVCGMSERGDG